jgi:hypothetical protein
MKGPRKSSKGMVGHVAIPHLSTNDTEEGQALVSVPIAVHEACTSPRVKVEVWHQIVSTAYNKTMQQSCIATCELHK